MAKKEISDRVFTITYCAFVLFCIILGATIGGALLWGFVSIINWITSK